MHAGEHIFPRCTLAYAPPEVVAAYQAGANITVAPAQDIWALGVMAFEALTGGRAVAATQELFLCAAGAKAYPWDSSMLADAPPRWRKSRLRPTIEQCLAHDPAQRPEAQAIVEQVNRLWVQTSL